MAKKRVYVESSVISYLTARPAKDKLKKIHQELTAEWWERRDEWDCFLTTAVKDEISRGDLEAAMKRQEKAALLKELPELPKAKILADVFVERKLIPASTVADAVHLTLAAIYRAKYLLTWNQKHLDNMNLRFRIEELIRGWGLTRGTWSSKTR